MNLSHVLELVSPKEFWNNSKNYIDVPAGKRCLYLVDFYFNLLRYGCTVTDYLVYEFYAKRHIAKKDYVTLFKLHLACHVFNSDEDRMIFTSKRKFNERYSSYRGLDWLDCSDPDVTFEKFRSWCDGKMTGIVKKSTGGGEGKNVSKISLRGDLKAVYGSLFPSKNIIEETFLQDGWYGALNPDSVNTIRVFTLLRPEGNVDITYVVLRIGVSDDFRDNAAGGNIFALVDPDTGYVVSEAMDKKLHRYVFHPKTGLQIVGLQLPRWKEVKEMVVNAAKEVPSVRYVGWDVAVSENKITLIEGNDDGDPVMQEMLLGHGIWHEYKRDMTIVKRAKI